MHCIAAILLAALSVAGSATLTVNGRQYYINGINVPWNSFGSDAGRHYQWGELYNATWFETFFSECETYGVNAARLWIHCDGRSELVQETCFDHTTRLCSLLWTGLYLLPDYEFPGGDP